MNTETEASTEELIEAQAQINKALSDLRGKMRKTNASPRGPRSVRKPMTGRALRRAMGQTNRDHDVSLVGEFHFAGADKGKILLLASPRAPKRISGSRKKMR